MIWLQMINHILCIVTVVSEKHYCSSCGKSWDCPQGNDCGKTPETTHDTPILCSKCFNKSKTEFGEKP